MEPAAGTTTPASSPRPWRYARSLARLKKWWEIAAPIAAIAYGIGYLARALHAYQYNFGALPGARFEYFVAGGLVLASVALLVAIILLIHRMAIFIDRWCQVADWRAYSINLALWVLIAALLFGALRSITTGNLAFSTAVLISISAAIFILSLMLTYYAHDHKPRPMPIRSKGESIFSYAFRSSFWSMQHSMLPRSRFTKAFARTSRRLAFTNLSLSIAAAATAVIVLSASALQFVPQEFGGVKPKPAILDLERKTLSPELASLLADPATKPEPGPTASAASPALPEVMRSRCVSVFSTADPWLIRIRDEQPGKPGSPSHRSIRISGDSVHSVEWISAESPGDTRADACVPAR